MSWQAYVDTSLVGSGSIDKAAIFNVQGTSVWASSAGFTVTPQEIKVVVDAYNDKNTPKKIQMDGVHIGGERFVVVRDEGRGIYGRKQKEGIIIVKTVQAILVAHYPETVQPGSATTVVEKLADYLVGMGY